MDRHPQLSGQHYSQAEHSGPLKLPEVYPKLSGCGLLADMRFRNAHNAQTSKSPPSLLLPNGPPLGPLARAVS